MLELPEKIRRQQIIISTQTSHRLPVQNCPKKTKAQQQTYIVSSLETCSTDYHLGFGFVFMKLEVFERRTIDTESKQKTVHHTASKNL